MKPTDVMIPVDPKFLDPKFNDPRSNENLLQLAIVKSKDGTQVIELNNKYNRPKYIYVSVESGEWVKASISKRSTVQVDPFTPMFEYICYNLTVEKQTTPVDPDCDYFVTTVVSLNKKTIIESRIEASRSNKPIPSVFKRSKQVVNK
jgi:hypothetical protein